MPIFADGKETKVKSSQHGTTETTALRSVGLQATAQRGEILSR